MYCPPTIIDSTIFKKWLLAVLHHQPAGSYVVVLGKSIRPFYAARPTNPCGSNPFRFWGVYHLDETKEGQAPRVEHVKDDVAYVTSVDFDSCARAIAGADYAQIVRGPVEMQPPQLGRWMKGEGMVVEWGGPDDADYHKDAEIQWKTAQETFSRKFSDEEKYLALGFPIPGKKRKVE